MRMLLRATEHLSSFLYIRSGIRHFSSYRKDSIERCERRLTTSVDRQNSLICKYFHQSITNGPQKQERFPRDYKTTTPKPSSHHSTKEDPSPSTQSVSFYKRALPSNLIPMDSALGTRLLRESMAAGTASQAMKLLSHFSCQSDPMFCALGTLTTVLNAHEVDPGRGWKGIWRWWSDEMFLLDGETLKSSEVETASMGNYLNTESIGLIKDSKQEHIKSNSSQENVRDENLESNTSTESNIAIYDSTENGLVSQLQLNGDQHHAISDDCNEHTFSPLASNTSQNTTYDYRLPIEQVRQHGVTFDQFHQLVLQNGLHGSTAHRNASFEQFTKHVYECCSSDQQNIPQQSHSSSSTQSTHSSKQSVQSDTNQYKNNATPMKTMVVSFARSALGQTGIGHFSPVAAVARYAGQDYMLVLDVAKFKYPPYWVSLRNMHAALEPKDSATGKSRGYFIMQVGNANAVK